MALFYEHTKQLSFERICKYSHHEKHDKCGKIHRKHIPTEKCKYEWFLSDASSAALSPDYDSQDMTAVSCGYNNTMQQISIP